MCHSFDTIKYLMAKNGVLAIACGDNLVAGFKISTWKALNKLLELRGFKQFDQFGDAIARRYVPPSSLGHKGLIKSEVISAFRL